jgi:Cu+-exporting ATPase
MPQARPGSAQIELAVRGMRCAACVEHVERALRAVPGVAAAVVNLATAQATICPAENGPAPSAEALIQAVRAAGYDAQVLLPSHGPAERHAAPSGPAKLAIVLSGLLAVPLLLLHVAQLLPGQPESVRHTIELVHHWRAGWAIQGALAATVLLVAGRPMLAGAFRALARGRADMDLLVSLGLTAAMLSGLTGIAAAKPELVTFDAAALITWFVAVGKHLETRARRQALTALRGLACRIPERALRVADGRVESVPADVVQPGDVLRVPAHTTVPVDGYVIDGHGLIDESLLTGESLPVARGPGEPVLGGSRCVEGLFDMQAAATGAESTAARIARLVQEVQAIKPPWQRLADRVSGIFVPAVLVLAGLTFGGWLYFAGLSWAVERAIAVLVVACPCALGLAIPTAVVVGTARAAELGILVRDPAALEAAAKVRQVVLDKTGTLTRGFPTVVSIRLARDADESRVLSAAAALAQLSEHPVSRAVVRAAQARDIPLPKLSEFRSVPGAGLQGQIEGVSVHLGSLSWLRSNGATLPAELNIEEPHDSEMIVLGVALDHKLHAVLIVADPVHPDAAVAVRELRRLGVRLRVLSGDREKAVRRIAAELDISEYEAELSPQQKLDRLSELVRSGQRVAMVGDGVNDAPALAAADVGIAFATGAELARQAAPVCIVGHSPRAIPRLIQLSRASTRIMKQNLAWALIYNLLMLPVAILTPLPPAWASAAMMLSSLSVVANSLRLRRAG